MERYIFTRNFILTTLIVCLNALHAQTGVNDKYINVDLSRGSLNLSIPLYTLKTRTLACPISLNYSQVDLITNNREEAYSTGSTGLGWILNAGGFISRKMKGVPDESVGNTENNLAKGNFNNNQLNFDPKLQSEYDPEEDEFTFNFYGYTGTFIYYRGEWKIFSDDEFKIFPLYSNNNELLGFEIITQDGIVYEFGGNDQQRRENSVGFGNGLRIAWYLTCITSPEGEIITFDYTKADIFYPQTSYIKTTQDNYIETLKSENNSYSFFWQKINSNIIKYYPPLEDIQAHVGEEINHVYLTNITGYPFNIDLNYVNTNEPFAINAKNRNPLKLDNITVKYNDISFKKYILNFDDKIAELLKLKSIQEFATTGNTITGSMPAFSFLYADKNDATSPESLTKLNYPTGGYSSFEYEYDTELKNLRLKKQISQGANSDKELTTIYHYVMCTNGGSDGVPDFDLSKNKNLIMSGQNSLLVRPSSDGVDPNNPFLQLFKENTYRYSFYSGNGAYKYEVEVDMGDYIYSDRTYNSTVQEKATAYSSVWVLQSSKDASNIIHSMGYKHYSFLNFSEMNNIGLYNDGTYKYERIFHNANDVGKIKRYEEYNPNGSRLKDISYEYKKINEKNLLRHTIHTVDYTDVSGTKMTWYDSHKYTSNYYKYKLVKETETSTYYTKITDYTYDPNTYLLREKKITGHDLDLNTIVNRLDEDGAVTTQTVNYRYLSDFNTLSSEGKKELINIPVETIYKKDGKITGVEYVKFKRKNYSGNYVDKAETIYTLDITQPIAESDYIPVSNDWSTLDPKLKPRISYAYDEYANLIEEADASGNKITYFGKTNTSNIPLIVLKGIGYAEFQNSSAFRQSSINKTRALRPDVQITNYTYDPKHGTYTSVTTPNGLTTTYEYDDFGRLRYIRDNNQNLINIYEYTTNVH